MDSKLNYKRIVIKIGSSSLTHAETGRLNLAKMEHLVRQLSDLHNQGMDVCLVSSGAIAVGRAAMGVKERPSETSVKQACAAVGQAKLMMVYQKLFAEYSQTAGQILLTKNTMVNPVSRANAKNTFDELFHLGVVPVVNENDTVSTYEMQFGDNDTLSAIVASISDADLLIILSDIDGLYDADPRTHENARIIHEVPEFTRSLFSMAGGSGTARGTGGMYTKLQAAEICVRSGIDMIVAKSDEPEILYRLVEGEQLGTLFYAENVHPQLKKRDIIIGTAVKGRIYVDKGCSEAILQKGSSLLPVGIVSVEGQFSDGDTVAVYCGDTELARGITHYNNADIEKIKGCHSEKLESLLGYAPPYETVIHRDNLLIMR